MNVINLATDETRTHAGLHPIEAVMAAFLQDTGDYNTWDYKDRMANMFEACVFGRKTVCYGDWCAILCN